MKLLRLTLACSLLLLSATASYALPCSSCTAPEYPYCESTPDSGTRCLFGVDYCEDRSAPLCSGFTGEAASNVMAEFTVASIEISRPGAPARVVTSPSAVAEVRTADTAVRK